MRARTSDISPKLRSVLFLIDGERTLSDLLDRAGSLGDLLHSQNQPAGLAFEAHSGPLDAAMSAANLAT
ncbi:MAG: hypothetical protein ABL931_24015, partial [Usitatibacteraceae bacterium]